MFLIAEGLLLKWVSVLLEQINHHFLIHVCQWSVGDGDIPTFSNASQGFADVSNYLCKHGQALVPFWAIL